MEKQVILIDSTFLDKLQACAFQYHISRNLQIVPKDVPTYIEDEARWFIPNEPLEKGDLAHWFFKHYYNSIRDGASFEAAIEIGKASFRERALGKKLDIADTEWVLDCIVESATFYRNDGWIPRIIEQPFIKQLHETEKYKFLYAGQIDLITQTVHGNVVVDHKTYSRWYNPSFLSNQFMSYCWASGLRFLIVNRVGLQKSYDDPAKKHRRPILQYNDNHIKQWEARTIWWMEQLAFYLEENTWPQNPTSCDKFNGCPYKSLCNAESDAVRDWLIQSEFRIGEIWDVSKELEFVK